MVLLCMVCTQVMLSPHQQQVHGVKPAELLADAVVAGLQQGGHQSGHMKAGVPQRLLQNANGCKYCTFLLHTIGKKSRNERDANVSSF